jgi:prophage DNA circulation protein
MAWNDFLLPASWRGVPFGVLSATVKPGRQTAEHTYPYREIDPVWVEDIGAGARPFSFTGFLVDGDIFAAGLGVFLQRDLMVNACQQKGTGTLIHPSLGVRTVALVGGCEMVERPDMGGAIELTFTFMESATGSIYPASSTSTQSASTTAAANTDSQTSSSFGSSVMSAVQSGADAVGQAVSTVGGFVDQAVTVVGTATRYAGALAGLAGAVGRFSSGSRTLAQNPAATASSLLALATTARTGVTVAADSAKSLASLL